MVQIKRKEPVEEELKILLIQENFPRPIYMMRVGQELKDLEKKFVSAIINCLEKAKKVNESTFELFLPQ